MTRLLTVFGATGLQGGALIDYVLKHPKLSGIYRLRGVTRDVSKEAAVALKKRGVETVRADMDDKASINDAVAGSYAIFAMTNYWEKASADVEIAQGKTITDAAVAVGATLLIWSSLPHVTRMSGGKITSMKHFDSKADVETYIRGLPIKSAFYMPAAYMQNTKTFFKPQLSENGILEFAQPWDLDSRLPMIDIADTGKFLAPILLDPEKYDGKSFPAATAFYTSKEIVDVWTKITGKKVEFVQTSAEMTNAALPPEMVEGLKGLINDCAYYGPTGVKDLEWVLAQMDDVPTSWEDFVKANGPWFEDS